MRTKDLYSVNVNSYANMYAICAHIVCISVLMSFPFAEVWLRWKRIGEIIIAIQQFEFLVKWKFLFGEREWKESNVASICTFLQKVFFSFFIQWSIHVNFNNCNAFHRFPEKIDLLTKPSCISHNKHFLRLASIFRQKSQIVVSSSYTINRFVSLLSEMLQRQCAWAGFFIPKRCKLILSLQNIFLHNKT